MDWERLEREPGRALVEALLDDPRDREAWSVFGDFLAEHDERLGQCVALGLRREVSQDDDERDALSRKIREVARWRQRDWKDPELARIFTRRGKLPTGIQIHWRYGFIESLILDGGMTHDRPGLDLILARVFASPFSRFLSRLWIDFGSRHVDERDRTWATLVGAAPRRALRRIDIRDLTGHLALELPALSDLAPRLDELRVGGRVELGRVAHEHLRVLSIMTREQKLFAVPGEGVSLPSLEWLGLALRNPNLDPEQGLTLVDALVLGSPLPRLEHLHIELAGARQAITDRLEAAGLLDQLSSFELLEPI